MSLDGAARIAAGKAQSQNQNQQQSATSPIDQQQPQQSQFQGNGYATIDDFLTDYKTTTFTLRNGKKIELQALDPGDFIPIDGSPIRMMMTEAGLEFTDDEVRQQFIADMSTEQRTELLERHLVNVKRVAVKSIISLPVSLKPQHECAKNVLSIERFSDGELLDMWDAIRGISIDEEETAAEEETFPSDSEDDQQQQSIPQLVDESGPDS